MDLSKKDSITPLGYWYHHCPVTGLRRIGHWYTTARPWNGMPAPYKHPYTKCKYCGASRPTSEGVKQNDEQA